MLGSIPSAYSTRSRNTYITTFGDDSDVLEQFDHSVKEEERHSIRIRALKRTTSIGMSKGCTRHQSYAVIDPGADMEVIGGVG